MSYYYNKNGDEISLIEYARLSKITNYKKIGYDTIDNFDVSTVWLGIDYNFGEEDRVPIIFETMIFKSGPFTDLWCKRYSVEAEAFSTHQIIVAGLKDGLRIEDLEKLLTKSTNQN